MQQHEVIHKPTGHLGIVFMTNEELYSLASNHYIMVYLDIDCEIKPTLVNFGELKLCDHIKNPPSTRRF